MSSQYSYGVLTASPIKHLCLTPSDFCTILPAVFLEIFGSLLNPHAHQFLNWRQQELSDTAPYPTNTILRCAAQMVLSRIESHLPILIIFFFSTFLLASLYCFNFLFSLIFPGITSQINYLSSIS